VVGVYDRHGNVLGVSEMRFMSWDHTQGLRLGQPTGSPGMVVNHHFPGREIGTIQTWSTEIVVSGRYGQVDHAGVMRYQAMPDAAIRMSMPISGQRTHTQQNMRITSTPGQQNTYVDYRLGNLVPSSGFYSEPLMGVKEDGDFPDNTMGGTSLGFAYEAVDIAAASHGINAPDVVSIRTNFATRVVDSSGAILATHYWRHTQNIRVSCATCRGNEGVTTTIVEYLGGVAGAGSSREELVRALEQLQQENVRNFREENPQLRELLIHLRGR